MKDKPSTFVSAKRPLAMASARVIPLHGAMAREPFVLANPRVFSDFVSGKHDHRGCVRDALRSAEAVCDAQGIRLTDIRRRILELVWSGHGPIGAYELLRLLNSDGETNAAPNTVYRALDFLLEAGLIHRLDSLNAFIGCPEPQTKHNAQFLICKKCNAAAEIYDSGIDRTLSKDAEGLGFAIDDPTIEVLGLCPKCKAA